jgi:hypothetical protein
MKYDLLVENWKKYVNELDVSPTSGITAKNIEDTVTKQGQEEAPVAPTEQENRDHAKDAALKTVEASLDDIKDIIRKYNIPKDAFKADLKKTIDAMITEKDDRCTRLAKQKYKVWPSAYASGAVVKCRQGKIWKGVSESATDEEIDLALLTEEIEIIEEKWSDKYKRSINCKNPKGFSQKAHCQGRKKK